jgi:hypothetical protein
MRQRNTWVVVALALALAAPAASAATGDFQIAVVGGASVPLGDYSDVLGLGAGPGWNAGIEADVLLGDRYSVGLGAAFHANAVKGLVRDELRATTGDPEADIRYSALHFGLHAKVAFAGGASVLGPGLYNVKSEVEATGTSLSRADSRLGFRGGVGTSHRLNDMVSVGGQVNYHWVSTDEQVQGASSLTWVDARVGFTFAFGAPPAAAK